MTGARQLANPREWIGATLRQAWADYVVGSRLFRDEIEEPPYGGRTPVDAVLDNYQQSLEKLLKAILLQYVPMHSEIVFEHKIISRYWREKNAKANKIRAALQKFFDASPYTSGFASFGLFERIERLVPDLSAVTDVSVQHGRFVELPENTQYPYTLAQKLGRKRAVGSRRIVAPCDQLHVSYENRVQEFGSSIRCLFEAVEKDGKFTGIMDELEIGNSGTN
ncbi:hypothetical protein HYR69_11185 [Candidatus Sumerlaeota bacterium]|nr:hypothetical protein [Candidatus Sumerlaeota bacterium]